MKPKQIHKYETFGLGQRLCRPRQIQNPNHPSSASASTFDRIGGSTSEAGPVAALPQIQGYDPSNPEQGSQMSG